MDVAVSSRLRYINTMLTATSQNLRDIRPDLRERLRVATAERDHMRSIIETLEATVKLLDQMLAAEERRFGSPAAAGEPQESLAEFILATLRASTHTKDSLRFLAEKAGYHIDGRSIHATLVNLTKSGKAEEIRDGEFCARE